MYNFYYRESLTKDLESVEAFKSGVWIDVQTPTDLEIEKIASEFELEPGHIQDAQDPFEVPRLEIEENAIYVFVRVPEKSPDGIITVPFMVALGEQFIMTVSRQNLEFLHRFISGSHKVYTTQRVEFLAQLISAINASYSRHIMEISRQVRSIRVRLEHIENRDIIKFVDYEQVLNDFISALIPLSGILRGLLRNNAIKQNEDNHDLFEDLLLSNEQLIESTKATLKTIVNIRDSYSTIMGQDLNRVIKVLTALTIIVTLPTMISSFYGMNVQLPFDKSPNAFYGIVGTTITVVLVLWVVFKRNRWL